MPLLIPVAVIISLSLLSLTSIAPAIAINQLVFILLGLFAFFIFSRIPYTTHHYLIKIYAVAGIILLILPFVFGELTRGAVRWIQLGSFTIQPSEIIKPFVIIIFSFWIAEVKKFNYLTKFGYYILLLVFPALLIFKQPDLGSTLVILAIWLGIFLASKLPKTALFILIIIGALVSPFAWHQLKPYQQQRVSSFINPYADPQLAGYHVIQSVISIGSGGFWGRGLGSGPQSQLKFLPERHTDFIFASLAEEMGFVGSVSLLLAYFWLFKYLLKVSNQAPDEFGRLLVIGVFSLLSFQTVVNLGMNLGLMPITGITLPLVSSGGSSVLAIFISLGIVNNISISSRPKQALEIK